MKYKKQRLVILGSGFASFSTLKNIDTELYDVIVVSPRNHFLFTPLLPSTTVGTIEFRSIIEPVRTAKENITFYHAFCTHINHEEKVINCKNALDGNEFSLQFDILVIGVGAISNTYGIEGVEKFTLPLKELSDARAIRQRIIENFERASTPGLQFEERKRLLHFVVVGGGPTGVEFAAELHDFLTEDLVDSYPAMVPDVDITLLEAGDQILNTFDAALSEYTVKNFQRQKISVRLQSQVAKVEEKELILKDGSHVPYGLLVWSTGNTQTPLIKSLPFEKDRASRLVTDEYFHLKGFHHIYAFGDCATIEGEALPATSQVAQQEGYYLARSLNALAKNKPVRPFRYKHYGMLAYIGSNKALADLPQVKGKGFSTWLFWRSAYLTKLVRWKNKILVIFDWTKAFIFGRDASRF
ncbi:MAG: FAD-dependent oxidoreductase [Ignavibacteriales bacterium]|nr:FAD-dependent oxidoreductase [Ignavibacteriales bacterium]